MSTANVPFHKRLTRLAKRRDGNGRRRPTQLLDWEREDILTLARAGYSQADIVSLVDRSKDTVAWVIAEDKDVKRKAHEERVTAQYMRASEVAAERGDHKPAMDWLDRYGAIPETSRQRTQLQAATIAADGQRAVTSHLRDRPSPSINIGIALPSQLGMQVPLAGSLEGKVISGHADYPHGEMVTLQKD